MTTSRIANQGHAWQRKKTWMASFLLESKHNKKNQGCQSKSHFQGWHLMWHPCVNLLSHLFHFSYLMYCVLNITFLLNIDHVSFILCIYVLCHINMIFKIKGTSSNFILFRVKNMFEPLLQKCVVNTNFKIFFFLSINIKSSEGMIQIWCRKRTFERKKKGFVHK